jgi:hypothetical protein
VKVAPVPPVGAFDAWLLGELKNAAMSTMTGGRLRRMVIMRNDGTAWKEVGYALGITPNSAKKWFSRLPTSLSGKSA